MCKFAHVKKFKFLQKKKKFKIEILYYSCTFNIKYKTFE